MKSINKFATVLAVGVTVMAVSSQTASATLNIQDTYLQNAVSGSCVLSHDAYSAGAGGTCGTAGTYFTVISAAPDAGGHAYVHIQTTNNDPAGAGYCLYAVGQGTGPSGSAAGSSDVELENCNDNDPRALWAMARAGADNYNVTPETFFNFDQRVCLDGGIGLYAYREEGCNSGNNWQVWNVPH